jgi:phenylacetate-CoA ligase
MRFRFRDYAFPVDVLRCRRLMAKAPWWPSSQLEDWLARRRTDILAHAFATVPYYRRLAADYGLRAEDTRDPEVWQRLPVLEKDSICTAPDDFVSQAPEARSAVWTETSGSTGLRLRILLDRHVNAAAFALFWRAWGSGGVFRLGQRHAVMKGLHDEAGWRYNRAIRALELSSAQVDPARARLFRDLILRFRPRFLRGYPSAMYLFARLLREQGLELSIPMVISGSETLYGYQRREIESFFQARLYNHYTHWERAASILECEAGSLHAQQDYGFHEILDEAGRPVPPGVPGVITVTTLHNRAMPLIRYRTGDIALWSPERCPCGQSFPVVHSIEGRQTDYLVTPKGAVIPGTFAAAAFWTLPHLLYAQIVQHEPMALDVRIVKAEGFTDEEDSPRIIRALRERVGPDLDLRLRYCGVHELERSPAGKIRQCFNRLPNPDGGVALRWGAHVGASEDVP